MLKMLNPARQAGRCFLPDPEHEGVERFHPFRGLGHAYRVEDSGLRAKLLRFTWAFHASALVDLAFLLFWLGFYRGPDRMMRFAPPLLLLAASAMAYRVGLRSALKGVEPVANIWSGREAARDQALGSRLAESLLILALLVGLLLLGHWLGSRL